MLDESRRCPATRIRQDGSRKALVAGRRGTNCILRTRGATISVETLDVRPGVYIGIGGHRAWSTWRRMGGRWDRRGGIYWDVHCITGGGTRLTRSECRGRGRGR